jgi:hypothetical protein
MRRKKRQSEARGSRRGFALLVVVIIVALLAATVVLALREATSGLAAAGSAKSAELVYADLNGGLSQAINVLAQTDPITIVNPVQSYDIFNDVTGGPARPFKAGVALQPLNVAPTGTVNSLYGIPITLGLKIGQKTEPPPGEDVRVNYGYIVEVQLQADIDSNDPRNGGAVPAQERVSVGVRVPMQQSHSNY